jgi:uncharacterized protein (DUF2236 family)
MLWTIAPAADSAIYFYELFVRELAEAERDEFWADYVRFGELFGMSASVAPTRGRDCASTWTARSTARTPT